RAVAATTARILRIAFELLNLISVFVDIGEQSARRLAVETGRRHELIASLFAPRPGLRIQLSPIIPALLRRKRREMNTRRAWIEGFVLVHSPSQPRNDRANSLAS